MSCAPRLSSPRRRGWTRRTVQRVSPWLGIGIVLLALALRLPFLTARSLWFDEAFSWRLVAYFPSAEFFSRAAADVHPVLYYALLWLWMLPARTRLNFADVGGSVAGGPALLDPESTLLWMRLLSVFLGTATVAAMILAGRVLFRSRWVAGAAGLLTAVNAFQLQYAWEARMYTLGTVLLPLAMVGLVRAVGARTRRQAVRAAIGFALPLGALLHVHYYALFSWIALGAAKLLYFLGQWWRYLHGDPSLPLRTTLWRRFRAAEVGFWCSAALFLPWLPIFLAQVRRVEAAFWIPRLEPLTIPNTLTRLFWGGVAEVAPLWAVLASLAALALVLITLLRGRSLGDLIAAASFVIPVAASALVSLRTSVFLDRYFLFASLGLILLLARALSFTPRRWRNQTLGLVAVAGLVSILQFWNALDFPAHPGARAATAFLATRAGVEEPVIVSSPFAYFPISFHLGCQTSGARCQNGLAVRLYSETGALIHFAGGPILTPADIVGPEAFHVPSPVARTPSRVWVVDTTGFGGSRLPVPAAYTLASQQRFPELFAYQGDLIVREYVAP